MAQESPIAEILPIVLRLRPVVKLNDRQFAEFCSLNDDLRIERTCRGELEIMPLTHSETGDQNAEITMQLRLWSKADGTGRSFDSSTGFRLPNGALRAPDGSWVRRSRLAALSAEEKMGFFPLCPDFVIELRSHSDRLGVVQAKMQEYMENGAQLGWLIDPLDKQAYIYRPGEPVQLLDQPSRLSGDPLLPGFVLDLTDIWRPAL